VWPAGRVFETPDLVVVAVVYLVVVLVHPVQVEVAVGIGEGRVVVLVPQNQGNLNKIRNDGILWKNFFVRNFKHSAQLIFPR
jgi:hypothetical protein